ncbi:hypothetical protein CTA2_9014 [Colletotrichum tanaceti]|uniref:Uncharacterized protein n=1 Tax=Colletotrichum tanaceti TaxID=1306861 RepID=A0A4U6XRR2_9PEZI|nr:hypothetical protein CTA2_9014 [Colletotrichum tanaceti]TKW58585.1 hypothetical protein CTA1_11417 [Colletotrichum tanaceti]
MCWRKQTIYTGCRHSEIEEIACDDQKKSQRRYDYPATSMSQYQSYQEQHQHQHQHQHQQKKSSWLALICPCFSLTCTSPSKEKCRLKPILEPLNGKCPHCLKKKADAAVLSDLGVNSPQHPGETTPTASKRQGFVGNGRLPVKGRPGVNGAAYRVTEPQGGPHPERSVSSRSRRDGAVPTVAGRGDETPETSRNRSPLWVNARYEETARQERPRREQQDAQLGKQQPKHTQQEPAHRDVYKSQHQGPSGSSTSDPEGCVFDELGGPGGSTAHLVARPLQTSRTKENHNVTRKAKPLGRSTARVRRTPQLSVVAEEERSSGDHHAVGLDYVTEMSLDELFDEVEEMWQMAPSKLR